MHVTLVNLDGSLVDIFDLDGFCTLIVKNRSFVFDSKFAVDHFVDVVNWYKSIGYKEYVDGLGNNA